LLYYPHAEADGASANQTVTQPGSPLEQRIAQGKIPDGHAAWSDAMKIYVGNLSFDTTQESLEDLFRDYGQVDEVAIISDRETGRPRGFGFVTMSDDYCARKAIEALNGQDFEGRTLTVNEAKPRENRGGGGGGGRGGRGGRRDRW
jgi:RNA recognition motif-containing protein